MIHGSSTGVVTRGRSAHGRRMRRRSGLILALALLVPGEPEARAQGGEGTAPSCFLTAAGALEICRDGSEAEGVYFAPPPCAFARSVQILRLAASGAPSPLQVFYQGQSPLTSRRGREACADRTADDPTDAGALRSGRTSEQLATTMPPTEGRIWESRRSPERRRTRVRRGDPAPGPVAEGIGPRDPIAVAGRDWAGEEYLHVFLIATAGPEDARRRVQIQARTYDFERFEIRSRTPDGKRLAWTLFDPEGAARSRGRGTDPGPAVVLDETGKPVTGNCTGTGLETQGLSGSISVVDRTYHYFYTDVMPEDCSRPAGKRRTALYLRTSRDLAADKAWSSARTISGPLPPETTVRVAKGKGMDRWVLSYACRRPANAPGGPVPDLCVQATPDLAIGAIASLTLFSEPVEAGRSPTYLGLRSGGDGSGRYDRSAHAWMTDRYGNLDTPESASGRAGFLTWLDRLAPRADGGTASTLYGRPLYWATWSMRRVTPR